MPKKKQATKSEKQTAETKSVVLTDDELGTVEGGEGGGLWNYTGSTSITSKLEYGNLGPVDLKVKSSSYKKGDGS